MKTIEMPNGLHGVGYSDDDHIPDLTEGAFPQQRLLKNAPRDIGRETLAGLFQGAMACW